MTISDIAQPGLYLGAGGFAVGGAVVLWLTRSPELALRAASATSTKAAKFAAAAGVVLSVASTGALGIDAWKAGPPLPAAVIAAAEGGPPVGEGTALVEQEFVAPAPDEFPRAVRVELLGGGDRVNWSAVSNSGGELKLQVVNLDSLPNPSGRWTVCVGIPIDWLRVQALGPGWWVHGHHGHTVTDRDAGEYYTYAYQFEVPEDPGKYFPLKDSLRLSALASAEGEHRIGLGVTRRTDHKDARDFHRRRSTLTVDCSS